MNDNIRTNHCFLLVDLVREMNTSWDFSLAELPGCIDVLFYRAFTFVMFVLSLMIDMHAEMCECADFCMHNISDRECDGAVFLQHS